MRRKTIVGAWLICCGMLLSGQIVTDPVSPGPYLAGQAIGFRPVCYAAGITSMMWNFGDGATASDNGFNTYFRYHTYANPGNYTIVIYRFTSVTPICPTTETLTITVKANLSVTYSPAAPRAEQPITFQANNFPGALLDWTMGDGASYPGSPPIVVHRYRSPGSYTVRVLDDSYPSPAPFSAQAVVRVGSDIRSIVASKTEALTGETVIFRAVNFYSSQVRWDLGDGTVLSAGTTIQHRYARGGTLTVGARDENGQGARLFTLKMNVRGISDRVDFLGAELTFDDGKYYQVVPQRARSVRPRLRLKMNGTGIVSGQWLLDGVVLETWSETVYAGEVKSLSPRMPAGLPTIDPGIHTLTWRFLRPENVTASLPVLKYFVLPYEQAIELTAPPDQHLAAAGSPLAFAWQAPAGVQRCQVAMVEDPFRLMGEGPAPEWTEAGSSGGFTPSAGEWERLARERWIFWKVRGLSAAGQTVAESGIRQFKIVGGAARIAFVRVTDLGGRLQALANGAVRAEADEILIQGELTAGADAGLLIVQVERGGRITDRLAFRDVKKDGVYRFETALALGEGAGPLRFLVHLPGPASEVVGLAELALQR